VTDERQQRVGDTSATRLARDRQPRGSGPRRPTGAPSVSVATSRPHTARTAIRSVRDRPMVYPTQGTARSRSAGCARCGRGRETAWCSPPRRRRRGSGVLCRSRGARRAASRVSAPPSAFDRDAGADRPEFWLQLSWPSTGTATGSILSRSRSTTGGSWPPPRPNQDSPGWAHSAALHSVEQCCEPGRGEAVTVDGDTLAACARPTSCTGDRWVMGWPPSGCCRCARLERTVLRSRPEDADVDGGEERAQSMSAC
jgi:hypothetical protein